jgi:hypothetical protein
MGKQLEIDKYSKDNFLKTEEIKKEYKDIEIFIFYDQDIKKLENNEINFEERSGFETHIRS